MCAANVVDLLAGIRDEEAKGLEVVSVAAHLHQRYGVRFMQKERNAFCKFTIHLWKGDNSEGSEVKVSVFVLPPKGEEYKYTRFQVQAHRSWAEGESFILNFASMTTQQVFDLLGDLHNPAAYVYRLHGNRKNVVEKSEDTAA